MHSPEIERQCARPRGSPQQAGFGFNSFKYSAIASVPDLMPSWVRQGTRTRREQQQFGAHGRVVRRHM